MSCSMLSPFSRTATLSTVATNRLRGCTSAASFTLLINDPANGLWPIVHPQDRSPVYAGAAAHASLAIPQLHHDVNMPCFDVFHASPASVAMRSSGTLHVALGYVVILRR